MATCYCSVKHAELYTFDTMEIRFGRTKALIFLELEEVGNNLNEESNALLWYHRSWHHRSCGWWYFTGWYGWYASYSPLYRFRGRCRPVDCRRCWLVRYEAESCLILSFYRSQR